MSGMAFYGFIPPDKPVLIKQLQQSHAPKPATAVIFIYQPKGLNSNHFYIIEILKY